MMPISRDEHVKWAKHRALEYVEAGLLEQAVTSMMSDLGKHPETISLGQFCAPQGLRAMMSGDAAKVRSFIEQFADGTGREEGMPDEDQLR